MTTCPECGASIDPSARFCSSCGAAIAVGPPDRRRLVTTVFSDLTGSTQLGERHDAETVRRVLRRYFDDLSSVLTRHGGTVEKFVGDAVHAVFGIPTAHEDDALRAVRAAVEMRERLESLNEELEPLYRVRLANHTGINTGEVVTGDPSAHTLITGDAVNVAARLEQAAAAGEILLGDPTHSLVRHAVDAELLPPLELKGKSEPVTAWRLLELRPDASARGRRFDTPFVGREDELAVLVDALARVEQKQTCRRVGVVGEPGIGKSRLIAELARRTAGRARSLQARCLPYGEGVTFWPLAEMVRTIAAIGDDVPLAEARRRLDALVADEPDGVQIAERIAAAMGIADRAVPAEETAWAARRLFETLAREGPLIVAFDDLHWAEPVFLDLLDEIAEKARAPILLVAAGRPELLEARPGWSTPTVALAPFVDDEAAAFVDALAGDGELTADVRARVRGTAQGNPLFMEETVAMLRERPDEATIPATIQALLTARLDGLQPRERDLLVRASIVGQELSRAALLALADDAQDLDEILDALARKDLLRPWPATYAAEAYQFRHVLVRDAAYATSLKETRSDLHERFARWLAGTTGDRIREYEELVGYHFEQAYRFRIEIAPGDPAAASLAAEAAQALGEAGSRAVARGDTHAAGDLLTRATAVDPDPVHRARLLTFLAEARLNAGDPHGAGALAEQAIAAATDHDRATELRARLRLAQVRMFTDSSADHLRLTEEIAEAAVELEQLGDLWGAADGWMLQLYAAMMRSADDLIHVCETARQLARRSGNGRVEAEAVFWEGAAAGTGPMPVDDAVAFCERLRAESIGGPLAEANALGGSVWLYGLAGRVDEARRSAARAMEVFHDLGLGYWVQGVAMQLAWVERLVGKREREEQLIRDCVTALQSFGDTTFLSTFAAELARTLAETGRPDEALEWVELARANTAEVDLDSQIGWRLGRAQALAAGRESAEAVQLAREAVDLAFVRDYPVGRAECLVVLAELLQAAGETAEARATGERALAELRRKGSALAVERFELRLASAPIRQ